MVSHLKKKTQEAEDIPQKKLTDADYANDLLLLANTPAQAEFLLHSLQQASGNISFYMNAKQTEYTCFKQKGVIS